MSPLAENLGRKETSTAEVRAEEKRERLIDLAKQILKKAFPKNPGRCLVVGVVVDRENEEGGVRPAHLIVVNGTTGREEALGGSSLYSIKITTMPVLSLKIFQDQLQVNWVDDNKQACPETYCKCPPEKILQKPDENCFWRLERRGYRSPVEERSGLLALANAAQEVDKEKEGFLEFLIFGLEAGSGLKASATN